MYLNRAETFPINIILQRCFQKVQLTKIFEWKIKQFDMVATFDHIVPTNDDFFSDTYVIQIRTKRNLYGFAI